MSMIADYNKLLGKIVGKKASSSQHVKETSVNAENCDDVVSDGNLIKSDDTLALTTAEDSPESCVFLNIETLNADKQGLQESDSLPVIKTGVTTDLETKNKMENSSNVGLKLQATDLIPVNVTNDETLDVDNEKQICSEIKCPLSRFELALVSPLPETPVVCRTSTRTSSVLNDPTSRDVLVEHLSVKSEELQKDEQGNEKTLIAAEEKTAFEKSESEIFEQFRKLEDIALVTPLPPTPVAVKCCTLESMNQNDVADKNTVFGEGSDCVKQQLVDAMRDENKDAKIKENSAYVEASSLETEVGNIVTAAAEFTAKGLLVFSKKLIYELGYMKDLPADQMETIIKKQYQIAASTKNVKWISEARYFAEVLFSKNWIDLHLPVITKDGRVKRQKKGKRNKRQQEKNDVYLSDEYMYRDVRLKTDHNLKTFSINAASSQNVDHRQKPYDRPARKRQNEKSADSPTSPLGKDVELEAKNRRDRKKYKCDQINKSFTDSVGSESSKSETSQTESQLDLTEKIAYASESFREESVEEKNVLDDESESSLQYPSSKEKDPSTETSSDGVVFEYTDKTVFCSVIEQERKSDTKIVKENISIFNSQQDEAKNLENSTDENEDTKNDVIESCLLKETSRNTEESLDRASEQVVMEVFDRALRDFDSSSEIDIVKDSSSEIDIVDNKSDNKTGEGTNEPSSCLYTEQVSNKTDEYLHGPAQESLCVDSEDISRIKSFVDTRE